MKNFAIYKEITFNDGCYEKILTCITHNSELAARYCKARSSWSDKIYPDELIADIRYSFESILLVKDVEIATSIAHYENLLSEYESVEFLGSHSCTSSYD